MSDVQRPWFQLPWEFRESAASAVVAVLVGFLIQFASGGAGVVMLVWPYNAAVLLFFALMTVIIGLLFRDRPVTQWLGGIPLGLSLIVAIAVLSLIGGIVPQSPMDPSSLSAALGLNRIFSSWPFAVTVLFFLLNLGLATVWKLVPFRMQNLQFVLFHAGFWIVLACGIFGAPDMQRLVVKVDEGGKSNIGYAMDSDQSYQLPFTIHLQDFALQEYPPNLLRYDTRHNIMVFNPAEPLVQVRKGSSVTWDGTTVVVLDYLPFALPGSSGAPEPADRAAGVPFAKVRIIQNGTVREEWISAPSPHLEPFALPFNDAGVLLVMIPGTPQAFESAVTVSDGQGNQKTGTVEVNKPMDFMDWKLYQMGYDEKQGRWSKFSLIEVIRDPWLPVVYLGFYMLLAGNLLFFWNGLKQSKKEDL